MPKFYKDKARQAAEQKKAEQAATTTKKGWSKREKELRIESRLHMHARFINKKVNLICFCLHSCLLAFLSLSLLTYL